MAFLTGAASDAYALEGPLNNGRALPISNRADALAMSQKMLRSDSFEERAKACDILRVVQDQTALPDLRAMAVSDPNPRVKERALQALRGMQDKASAPLIRVLLQNESDEALLRAALAALAELGGKEDIAFIRPYLQHTADSIRATAACALAALGAENAAAALTDARNSGVPLAQRLGVLGLGYLEDAKSLKTLEAILTDPKTPWHEDAQIAAARRTLRTLEKSEGAMAYLYELAVSAPNSVAVWAAEQLDALGGVEALLVLARGAGAGAKAARQMLLYRHGIAVAAPVASSEDKHEAPSHQAFYSAAQVILAENDCFSAAFYDANAQRDCWAGAAEEDDQDCSNQPCSLGPLCPAANRHFYNPITGLGLPHIPLYSCDPGTQMTALENAIHHWDWAVDAYKNQNFNGYNGAFHLLGQAMHLLQDVSVPAHVHVDNHLDTAGDDYEQWYKTYVLGGGVVATDGLTPLLPEGADIAALVDDMARYTYWMTAYYGVLVNNPDVQAQLLDHELGRMFHLAYFDGWFVNTRWELRDRNNRLVGVYDPNPLFDLGDDEWWPTDGNFTKETIGNLTYVQGYIYIENLLDGSTLFEPRTFDSSKLNNTTFSVGDSLVALYARELVPECLRRCAPACVVRKPFSGQRFLPGDCACRRRGRVRRCGYPCPGPSAIDAICPVYQWRTHRGRP